MRPLPAEARDAPSAERAAFDAVDDALRSFPLQPAPPGLATAVLAELRSPERAAAARPVFRLSWMDFALSGFVAQMLGLVLLLSGWLTPTAGRLQALAAGPLLQSDGLVWALALAGLVLTSGLLLVAGLVFRRPGSRRWVAL
jgi:hypothetical protein